MFPSNRFPTTAPFNVGRRRARAALADTATSGARDSDVHGERVEHGLRATRGDSWVAARAIVIVSSACVSLSLVVRYRYDNVKEANIQGNSKQFKQFKKK